MRRLRQVLLVEANATGDQFLCEHIHKCVSRLSDGSQHYGRQEAITEPGVDVRVTIIGHAQQWEGFKDTERDAPKVGSFLRSPQPIGLVPDEVIEELRKLRAQHGIGESFQQAGPNTEIVINRTVPALDYAIAALMARGGSHGQHRVDPDPDA